MPPLGFTSAFALRASADRSFNPGYEKKGSGTPAVALSSVPHRTGAARATEQGGLRRPVRYRARSPAGVPPRLLPRGVLSLGATRARLRGQVALPTSSDAPRTPVVMPAGMMPGPPGSGLQARPRAPPLAPPPRMPPRRRPLAGEMIRPLM